MCCWAGWRAWDGRLRALDTSRLVRMTARQHQLAQAHNSFPFLAIFFRSSMPRLQEPSDEEQLRAFRACPPLDEAAARQLCPDIMATVMQITNTLGVCWQWTLAAMLSMVSGLVPQARYELAPSVEVPASMWVVLLHPGSTNSSGVIRLVIQSLQRLFAWRAVEETARAEAEVAEGENVVYPPRRQLLAGGGSLAATGLQMSLPQNRSAALLAEPEIGSLLQWFGGGDSYIDSSAVAKVWDGVSWDRPVMDKHRAFTVENPWLGFITGGHVAETFKATVKDVFGFRQRVTALYGEPLWLSLEDIRAACEQLPLQNSRKPADFVATLLLPLLRWSLTHDTLTFAASAADGAQQRTAQNFNAHVDMQKEAYLQPGQHEEARFHGKLRTKFDRMVLSVHVLRTVCVSWAAYLRAEPAGATVGTDWCPDFDVPRDISVNVVEFAYLFADHAESVWKVLDFARRGHSLPQEVDPAAPTQPAPLAAPPTVVDFVELLRAAKEKHMDTISKDYLDQFLGSSAQDVLRFVQRLPAAVMPSLTAAVLIRVMLTILQTDGRWYYYSKTDAKKAVRRALPQDLHAASVVLAFVASFLLQALGLGTVVLTVPSSGGGRPSWFFLKKIVPPQMHSALASVGISPDTIPSLQAYSDSVAACTHAPSRAPALSAVPCPRTADAAQKDSILQALGLPTVELPLPPALPVAPLRAPEDAVADPDVVGLESGLAAQPRESEEPGEDRRAADVAAADLPFGS